MKHNKIGILLLGILFLSAMAAVELPGMNIT